MKLGILERIQTFTGQDDDIRMGKLVLVQAKRLANDTPNAVAFDSPTDVFFGNDETDSGMIKAVGRGQNEQRLLGDLESGVVENAFEIPASQQTQLAGIFEIGHAVV